MVDNNTYKVGLYIRLSREDEDNNGESESITNQRNYLLEYVKNNHFILIDEYVDDGFTGTNFERPAFKRMIKDIELGKINCVITKDMSRLGRDYIGIGTYMEKYFPEHNIRYIAVNDNIDLKDGKIDNMAPIRAVFNDYYAKDISDKVKSTITNKKRNGQFLGGVPPYGYKFESDDNHYKLVIDEETSIVVKRMFNMFVGGKSLKYIADTLTSENIPIPSIHKNLNRGLKSTAYGVWQTRTIDEILKNPTYIGNLTQGRRKKINYKIKKVVRVPKEQWIVCENTHEPIIDKETFEQVQNIYEKNKSLNRSKNHLLLSGFIYCKECGHRIGISQSSNKKFYCSCNYYKKYSKLGLCTPHSIPYNVLEDIILKEIRKECKKSVKGDKFKDIIKSNDKKEKAKVNLIQLIKQKKQDIENTKNAIDDLYIEKLKKNISSERYTSVYNKLNSEFNVLSEDLKALETDYSYLLGNVKNSPSINYTKAVNEYLALKNPTRELLANLIDKIVIDEDKNIQIYYKIKKAW